MTATMTRTDLNDLIRQVVAEYPEADFPQIARFVAKATPDELVMDFYIQVLVDRVRYVTGQDRRNSFNGPPRDDVVDDHHRRSPAVDRVGLWWQKVLSSKVSSSGRLIGDCGVDELNRAIGERRKQIAGHEAQIANYEYLISLLVKHGKRKVRDLPPQTSWPMRT